MCQKESWGAIFATTEAHSTQRDQPPRMHGPGLWMYEQKEQRVTPVRMIGVNCVLWCPGWEGKITVFHLIHSSTYNYDPNIVVTCSGTVGIFPYKNLVPHTEIQKHMYVQLDLDSATNIFQIV